MRRGVPLRSMMAAMVASAVLATAALPGRSTAHAAPLQTRSAAAPPTTLVDLRGPSDLRAAFNNDRGRLRIILLLSPT